MAIRWDKLRSATLDAPARQEVARLIRDERFREPVVERAGTVVEFRRGGQLMCGYLQCPPRGLLRVVGVDGRLRRLRRDKIVDVSRDLVALWPGEEALKPAAHRRSPRAGPACSRSGDAVDGGCRSGRGAGLESR